MSSHFTSLGTLGSVSMFAMVATLALSAVACGNVAEETGPGSTTEQPGTQPGATPGTTTTTTTTTTVPPDVVGVEGSFDLTFVEVTVSEKNPAPMGGGNGSAPSKDAKFRLDIKKNGSGYDAVVAGRWFAASAYKVTVTKEALVLEGGEASMSGQINGGYSVRDAWKTMRLARDGAGNLTGAFDATGEQTIWEGDAGWQAELKGSGTFATDKTVPEIKGSLSSPHGPDAALLPWDPVVFQTAEPLPLADVENAIGFTYSGAVKLPVSWDNDKPMVEDWAGITSVRGFLKDWPTSTVGSFVAEAGIKDRVGLATKAVSAPVQFLSVGTAMAPVGFDDDVMFGNSWGNAQIYGGGLTGATDPRCESGGCLQLGPVNHGGCNGTRTGYAVGLGGSTPATGARIRYRVFVHSDLTGDGVPNVYGNAINVETAEEGQGATSTAVQVQSSDLHHVPNVIQGHEWATDWRDLDASTMMTNGASKMGVGISIGEAWGCGGGPALPPTSIVVLIEKLQRI